MAYHRGREAQEPAPAATGRAATVTGDGGAEGFDANMAIILAALFLALMFAIGLNSLSRCALLRRWGWGRRGDGDAADAAPGGVKVKKRALRSIPVEVYGGGGEGKEEEVCAICLGEFADGEKVRVLPRCGHGFHVRCVDAWLLSRGSCPTCRRPVTGDAPEKGGGGGGVGQSSRPPDGDNIAVVVT